MGLNLGKTRRWGCAGKTVWELHSVLQGEALALTGKVAEIAIEAGGSPGNWAERSLQTTLASAVTMGPWGAVSVSCLWNSPGGPFPSGSLRCVSHGSQPHKDLGTWLVGSRGMATLVAKMKLICVYWILLACCFYWGEAFSPCLFSRHRTQYTCLGPSANTQYPTLSVVFALMPLQPCLMLWWYFNV